MDDTALQELLGEAATRLGVVGAQLALFDGSRVREFAVGLRHRELGLPVTTDTLFQIGSTTKVFNAALVMSLVDEGRLDPDTPVSEYIPRFRLANWEAQKSITLRHLLSMSGGIDNGSYHDYGRGDDALERYVAALAGVAQVFRPGSAFGYSNASTNVAGHAAACVTGETWEQLLAERILAPLSLTASAMFAEDLLIHPLALGYRRNKATEAVERVGHWALPRSCAPAGASLCCSAGDLVRFACMFLRNGRSLDGSRVLSESAVTTMQTPQIDLPTELMARRWCVGPYWKQWGGYTFYGHSGTNTGGSSMLLWCPPRQLAFATTVNVPDQGYPLADHILDRVLPELFGIAKPPAPDPEQITPVAVDLRRFTGRFEALGITVEMSVRDGRLVAIEDSDVARMYNLDALTESELIPLGGDRFLPRNPAFSGNRLWDVAFWDETGCGRATHYLHGVFALRRVG